MMQKIESFVPDEEAFAQQIFEKRILARLQGREEAKKW